MMVTNNAKVQTCLHLLFSTCLIALFNGVADYEYYFVFNQRDLDTFEKKGLQIKTSNEKQ